MEASLKIVNGQRCLSRSEESKCKTSFSFNSQYFNFHPTFMYFQNLLILGHSVLQLPMDSFSNVPSDFLRICQIHSHFLLYICNAIGFWFIIFPRISFETILGQLTSTIHLRQWLIKYYNLLVIWVKASHLSQAQRELVLYLYEISLIMF